MILSLFEVVKFIFLLGVGRVEKTGGGGGIVEARGKEWIWNW